METAEKKCPKCNSLNIHETFKAIERAFQSEYVTVDVYVFVCKDCREVFSTDDQEGEIKQKLGKAYRRLLGWEG